MKAVPIHSFGGPEVLKLEDLPIPAPGPDEVLIRVVASGVRHHATGEVFMVEPNGDELSQIGRMIDDGRVSVFIQQTFPMRDVHRAHDHLEHQHVRGKVVLRVAPNPTLVRARQ